MFSTTATKMSTVDKVDMSLDDIIKLNKKEAKGRGRGRGQSRGTGRGSGVRGVGRGMRMGSPVKGRGPVVFSRTPRGRGRGARAGRGRGGAANLSGMSPLNRSMNTLSPKPRGRGRGGLTTTPRLRGRGLGSLRGRGGAATQRLQQKRQQAIETLMKAKTALAKLNAQKRKSNRLSLVNKKRGLQASSNFGSQMSLNSVSSRGTGRLSRYGSTISLSTNASTGSGKRRRWRNTPRSQADNPVLTISVNNPMSSPPSPVRRGRGGPRRGQGRGGFVTIGNQGGGAGFSPRGGQGRGGRRKNFLKRLPVNNNDSDPVLAAQIKNLKPAVSTKYNFKKTVFSQAHTSVSLSDRFGTGASPGGDAAQEGRKVFF